MGPPIPQPFRRIKIEDMTVGQQSGQDVHGVPTQGISRETRGVAFSVRSADVSF
jgi:hypothetical protein